MSESLPYVVGSDTSEAAAASMETSAETLRAEVYVRIAKVAAGLTCDEVEVAMGLRHQTASARIRELVLKGSIIDSGRRRRTRSGREATIWIACQGDAVEAGALQALVTTVPKPSKEVILKAVADLRWLNSKGVLAVETAQVARWLAHTVDDLRA